MTLTGSLNILLRQSTCASFLTPQLQFSSFRNSADIALAVTALKASVVERGCIIRDDVTAGWTNSTFSGRVQPPGEHALAFPWPRAINEWAYVVLGSNWENKLLLSSQNWCSFPCPGFCYPLYQSVGVACGSLAFFFTWQSNLAISQHNLKFKSIIQVHFKWGYLSLWFHFNHLHLNFIYSLTMACGPRAHYSLILKFLLIQHCFHLI